MVIGINRGSLALSAFAGFSFVRDLKLLKDKKDSLSEKYDKCTRMLALLETIK